MKKTWFMIFLLLILVSSISGCEESSKVNNSGTTAQNLSEDEKLQKIANSLGYDRIEIEDIVPEHTFRWGVKDVENPQVLKIIKGAWGNMDDFNVLQYDELDETYQFKGKTLTITINQVLEPKQFIDSCEILFATILQKNEFDEYDSMSVNINKAQAGVIILTRDSNGDYSTSCPMNEDIQTVYSSNSFFSSLDLTSKLQDEYDTTLKDMETKIGGDGSSSTNNLATQFTYFQETIPGTWVCLEKNSDLSKIEFLYEERLARFTYNNQDSRDFYWDDYQISGSEVSIRLTSDDVRFPSLTLTITPTANMLTDNRVLINSQLFEKI